MMPTPNNGPHPPASDRLDEVAAIVAAGLLRLLARRRQENSSQSNSLRDIPLDFSPKESVCRHEPTQGREGR
jgi:hypothetical protein